MIIGLTGRNGAGKGVVADYLQAKSFCYHSLSEAIREEAQRRGLPVTRETLIRLGNELRREFGPTILAKRIAERLEPSRHYVIDSIRNVEEIRHLKESCKDFFLLNVEAPVQVRFARLRLRNRESDPQTFEDFQLTELREQGEAQEAQQLHKCPAYADFHVMNDSTVEALQQKVDELLRALPREKARPGWDEYFMGIAKSVALRSNCMKRKVAAVIVKDKRIISTGYNGTPRNITNCNEGGCPRCNAFAQGGTNLDECLCSHAEENAIVQAAYHGVPINGAVLYLTFSPCLTCAKMIINAGLREVVYTHEYPLNETAKKILSEAKVVLRQFSATP